MSVMAVIISRSKSLHQASAESVLQSRLGVTNTMWWGGVKYWTPPEHTSLLPPGSAPIRHDRRHDSEKRPIEDLSSCTGCHLSPILGLLCMQLPFVVEQVHNPQN